MPDSKCSECRKQIPPARLLALPRTRTCSRECSYVRQGRLNRTRQIEARNRARKAREQEEGMKYLFTIYQFGDPIIQVRTSTALQALEEALVPAIENFHFERVPGGINDPLPPHWPISRDRGEPVQGAGVEMTTVGGNRRVEIEARADRGPFSEEEKKESRKKKKEEFGYNGPVP